MKLLHLQLLPILSGVQNFSLHLLDGLDMDEYEIHIAASGDGDLRRAVSERAWHYHRLRFLKREIGLFDLPAFIELVILLKRGHYDIIHTNSSKPGLLGRIAARICGVPLIVHTNHGFPFQPEQGMLQNRLYRCLEWFSQLWGDHTAFVNQSDRLLAIRLGLIQAQRASTVYNAIPDRLREPLEEIAGARTKPVGRDIVIGSTMRFSTQKNAIQLIISAVKVCRQSPGIRFIILGDGEHYELCRRIVRENRLNERILMPGWENDIVDWLKLFDAFILYSKWEAQPFSIIEAMHSGLPVIGSDIDAMKELISEETGYIVPLAEPDKLEALLCRLAQDFDKAFAKGMRGHERIRELCNYRQMVSAYERIYRRDC